jgi:hypothetical protein
MISLSHCRVGRGEIAVSDVTPSTILLLRHAQ